MEISNKFLHPSHLLPSPASSHFSFRSNILKNHSFLQPFNPKWNLNPKKPTLCSISGSNSTNLGGWEDLKIIEDSNHSSKIDQFQHFLVFLGINDRKHVFMFIIGFVSALAISRVRVSSILVFPASVLVLAVGFSLGFVRSSGVGFSTKDMTIIGSKKACKDNEVRFSLEKLRTFVELLGELGVKLNDLERDMRGELELDSVQVGEFEKYCNVIKSLGLDIVEVKNLVESSRNVMGSSFSVGEAKGESFDDRQTERDLNQKSSRRKREAGTSHFNIFQLMGGLFQENASMEKPNKVKDIPKRELVEPLNPNTMNSEANYSVPDERTEQAKAINSEFESKMTNNVPEASRNESSNQHIAKVSANGAGKAEAIQKAVNGNSPTRANDIQTLRSNEEVNHPNYGSEFMNTGSFMETGHQNGEDMLPHDNFFDPLDIGVNMRSNKTNMRPFTMETKASVQEEEIPGKSNGYTLPSYRRKTSENGSYKFDFLEKREISGDPPNSSNQQTAGDLEESFASSPSSMISEDIVFSKNLTEATDLLKEARKCLKSKSYEDRAEIMLHKSARLLSRAAAMKPMSLLAIGQLGNTFLLHGELKLRFSRELRSLLSRNDSSSRGKSHITLKGLDDQNMSRDRIASVLVDVCEECEGLLVEAGRQYRMALSIDGNDVRALYNWGLALSYRAQLIADVGPEAASDADRVYLAAIDKFNAMISRNKAYAPDALFRWGVALQQRSRLRSSNAKEKKKLLHQAKSLFEDALYMDSNNVQVRKALSSCISELKDRHF